MKSHLAKVSLALLFAAFLLGCQEQGSEPVGPEGLGPVFAKPGACPGHPSCKDEPSDSPGNAVVTVTVVSHLLIGSEANRAASLVNGGSSIHNVELNVTDNACSASGDLRGIIGILDAQGTATYTFPVPLGSPRWMFKFFGGTQGGVAWPPDDNGESTTWTYTSWELTQSSPKGKESRVNCPINGTQSTTITVLKTG